MNHNLNRNRPGPARTGMLRPTSGANRSRPGDAGTTQMPQDARKRYERYLVLAHDMAQTGDRIGAENYYQHAEHYLRAMTANAKATG